MNINKSFKRFFDKMLLKEKPFETFRIEGNITIVLAFFIPFFLYILLLIINNIYPFGNRVYLPSDMYHQYAPFYSELWHKLNAHESLSFTWHDGLGADFSSIFTYYLSSPLTFIIALFPHDAIPAVMDFLIVLKSSLASMFFAIYLTRRFKTRNGCIVIFSVLYAMSGFFIAYNWNIMWLDCVALAPIVMLGVEMLIFNKKPLCYCISLGLCIIFNYYISIMLILASAIYFIALLATYDYKSLTAFSLGRIKKIFRFIGGRISIFLIASLIALGLSAFLLIPQVEAFSHTASADSSFPNTFKFFFLPSNAFSRHIAGIDAYTGLNHYPNLYAGVIIFALIPLFFLNKAIKLRDKLSLGIMTAILFVGFLSNTGEYIWHGLHVPNSLPARQSFLYIFFILVICFYTFLKRRYIKKVDLIISAIISYAFLAYVFLIYGGGSSKITDSVYTYSYTTIIVTMLLLGLYYVWMFFDLFFYEKLCKKSPDSLKKNGKNIRLHKNILTFSLLAVICAEALFNMKISSAATGSYKSYIKNDSAYSEIISRAKEISAQNDSSDFFRISEAEPRTNNDGSWYGYNSMSIFSSTAYAPLGDLYEALGLKSTMNSYNGLGATELIYSLFGINYTIYEGMNCNSDPNTELIYENTGNSKTLYAYKNKTALPVGYQIPLSLSQTDYTGSGKLASAISRQNEIFEASSGVKDLFTNEAEINVSDTASFSALSDGRYYFLATSDMPDNISVKVNGTSIKSLNNIKYPFIIDIGYLKSGDVYELSSRENLTGFIYRMDAEKLASGCARLKEHSLTNVQVSDTGLSGNISMQTDGVVMFTIPALEGFSVYVDGKKYETSKSLGAFLSVYSLAGDHEIVVKYEVVGQKTGIIISLISLAAIFIFLVVRRIFAGRKYYND